MTAAPRAGLEIKLRSLKLPSFVVHHGEVAGRAETGGWPFDRFLDALAELELEERKRRRIERLLKASHLPSDKTLATLDLARLPPPVKRQVPTLCDGGFVERAENVLAFGLPGRGKTHLLAAIGHELVQRGYRVVFLAAFRLVQQLLAAKRALTLEAELRRLDAVDALIVDDIGYIQQDREEMEVLFTLLAERYERRSVLISSNVVFSQWDRIFKDPMTTACAIDRVVHHATILELTGSSYRSEAAKQRNGGRGDAGGDPPAKEPKA
jgi:DNA replication protein DnaC